MALTDAVVGNYAQETTITTGTGTYNLDGVSSTTFQTIVQAQAEVTGDGTGPWADVLYHVTDGIDHEIGIGTLTDGTPDTLSRLTIIESTNTGAKVNWVGGPKTVIHGPAGQWLNTFVQPLAVNQILNFTTGVRYTDLFTALAALADAQHLMIGPGTYNASASGAFVFSNNNCRVDLLGLVVLNGGTTGHGLSVTGSGNGFIGYMNPFTTLGQANAFDALRIIGSGNRFDYVNVSQSDDHAINDTGSRNQFRKVLLFVASIDNATDIILAAGSVIESLRDGTTPGSEVVSLGTGAAVLQDGLGRRQGPSSALLDLDANTGIEVERTSDDNIVYIKTAGVDAFKIDAAGIVIKPLQPIVMVTPEAMTNLAVGSDQDLKFNSEKFDRNNDFNTTTFTFTAPVDGIYSISYSIYLEAVDTVTTALILKVVTTLRTYTAQYKPAALLTQDDQHTFGFSVLANMDSGDTAKVVYLQNTGAQQVDLVATDKSFLSIALIA